VNAALRTSKAHVFVDNLVAPQVYPDDEHHLLKVLRVRETDSVSVSDGLGNWLLASMTRSGELIGRTEVVREPAPRYSIGVAFAPVKGEKPEVIVQKLTELGVDDIVPLTTTRYAVVKWDESRADRQHQRLVKVAREAAMQSRRVWLPRVHVAATLESVLGEGAAFAEPGGEEVTAEHRMIVIGPEGGFAPEELEMSRERVSLGESILRAETAAIVAGTLMARCRRESR
jgi:16S rRNA (uracil1498-N3)-methyltransferase